MAFPTVNGFPLLASDTSEMLRPLESLYSCKRRRYSAMIQDRMAMPAARSPLETSAKTICAKSRGVGEVFDSPMTLSTASAAMLTSSPGGGDDIFRIVGSPSPMSHPLAGSAWTDMSMSGGTSCVSGSSAVRSIRARDQSSGCVDAATPAASENILFAPPPMGRRMCPSCKPIVCSSSSVLAWLTVRSGKMQDSMWMSSTPARVEMSSVISLSW